MFGLLQRTVFAAVGLVGAYAALLRLQHLSIPDNPVTGLLGGWLYDYFELEALNLCARFECPPPSSERALPRVILAGVSAWWGLRGLGEGGGFRGYALAALIAFLPAALVAIDANLAQEAAAAHARDGAR